MSLLSAVAYADRVCSDAVCMTSSFSSCLEFLGGWHLTKLRQRRRLSQDKQHQPECDASLHRRNANDQRYHSVLLPHGL